MLRTTVKDVATVLAALNLNPDGQGGVFVAGKFVAGGGTVGDVYTGCAWSSPFHVGLKYTGDSLGFAGCSSLAQPVMPVTKAAVSSPKQIARNKRPDLIFINIPAFCFPISSDLHTQPGGSTGSWRRAGCRPIRYGGRVGCRPIGHGGNGVCVHRNIGCRSDRGSR